MTDSDIGKKKYKISIDSERVNWSVFREICQHLIKLKMCITYDSAVLFLVEYPVALAAQVQQDTQT